MERVACPSRSQVRARTYPSCGDKARAHERVASLLQHCIMR